jgi:hypothetical protein
VVVGLVGGWALHPVAERFRDTAPIVTWAQPLALLLVTAILGATAYVTWRTVHVHHQRLDPHQAVNRLVLARACALVGALVAGGYFGYALSWVGVESELGEHRGPRRRGDRHHRAAPRARVSRPLGRRRALKARHSIWATAARAVASDLAALSATRRDSVPPSHLRLARYGATPRSLRRQIERRTSSLLVWLPLARTGVGSAAPA